MNVASLVFATNQGLGFLAKDFYDHGIINQVGIVRHRLRKMYRDWFPDAPIVNGIKDAREVVRDADIVLFFETPFWWQLIPFCRNRKIPTVLMTMYECSPDPLPYEPDFILCPSLLDLEHFPKGTYLPVPIPDWVQFKQRSFAHTFVHNAGHGGLMGRNGTTDVIGAIRLSKANCKFIIRTQSWSLYELIRNRIGSDSRTTIEYGTVDKSKLYEGDVFLFPERFNGLSLPLQEAFASGMACMATRRFPNTEYLPHPPLIYPDSVLKDRVAKQFREIEVSTCDPETIARKIDRWSNRDISSYSLQGKEFRERMSWDNLGPKYVKFLEDRAK